MKITVFSDIHIGASKFCSDEQLDALLSILKRSSYGIANGDIVDASLNLVAQNRHYNPDFDEQGIIENRTKKHFPKFAALCNQVQETEILYLTGNHDGFECYNNLVDEIKPANLTLYREGYLLWGNALYLHSDQIFNDIRGNDVDEAEQCEIADARLQAFAIEKGFDLAQVEHVFAGHTHRAFVEIIVSSGRKYHNSGSFHLEKGNGIIFECDVDVRDGQPYITSITPHYLLESALQSQLPQQLRMQRKPSL